MGQAFNLSLDFYREFPVITRANLVDRDRDFQISINTLDPGIESA